VTIGSSLADSLAHLPAKRSVNGDLSPIQPDVPHDERRAAVDVSGSNPSGEILPLPEADLLQLVHRPQVHAYRSAVIQSNIRHQVPVLFARQRNGPGVENFALDALKAANIGFPGFPDIGPVRCNSFALDPDQAPALWSDSRRHHDRPVIDEAVHAKNGDVIAF